MEVCLLWCVRCSENGIFILLLVCFLMHEERFFSYQICRLFFELQVFKPEFCMESIFLCRQYIRVVLCVPEVGLCVFTL